jgi:nucleoside-diphosphate-sugar epimerase
MAGKLYAERMAMAYARNRGMVVRIARFQNCYGPEAPGAAGEKRLLLPSAAK